MIVFALAVLLAVVIASDFSAARRARRIREALNSDLEGISRQIRLLDERVYAHCVNSSLTMSNFDRAIAAIEKHTELLKRAGIITAANSLTDATNALLQIKALIELRALTERQAAAEPPDSREKGFIEFTR